MKGKNHIRSGIITGCFIPILNNTQMTEFIPISFSIFAGAIIPDIDIQTSFIGKHIKPISKIINSVFGHRTLFHAPFVPITLLIISYYYKIPLLQQFSIGYFLHLFLDMCTAGGIPLFYPQKQKRYALSHCKSGARFEFIRMLLLTIIYINFVDFFQEFY